jgi:hypothetical protein
MRGRRPRRCTWADEFLVRLRTSSGRDGWIQFIVLHRFTSKLAADSVASLEPKFGLASRRFDATTTWPPSGRRYRLTTASSEASGVVAERQTLMVPERARSDTSRVCRTVGRKRLLLHLHVTA